jgi:cell division protein FtsL
MLDRWIPDKERGHYFTAEAFTNTVDAWDGVPLVYAQEHPDLNLFKTDPQKALTLIKTRDGKPGRIVGKLIDPAIVAEGHTRMMGALPIADTDVKDLWNEGKLGLSTAFFCDLDESGNRVITGGIEPNHILLFEENAINQPADKGALVNQEKIGGNNVTENVADTPTVRIKSALASLEATLLGIFQKEPVPKVEQPPTVEVVETAPDKAAVAQQEVEHMDEVEKSALTNQVALANKERDTLKAQVTSLEADILKRDTTIKEKDATIATKDTEMTAMKQQLADIEKADKDADFTAFLTTVKPALKNTEDQKKALREQFDKNPAKLLAGISNMVLDTKNTTDEVGTIAGERDAGKDEVKNTVGCYDPVEKKWVT